MESCHSHTHTHTRTSSAGEKSVFTSFHFSGRMHEIMKFSRPNCIRPPDQLNYDYFSSWFSTFRISSDAMWNINFIYEIQLLRPLLHRIEILVEQWSEHGQKLIEKWKDVTTSSLIPLSCVRHSIPSYYSHPTFLLNDVLMTVSSYRWMQNTCCRLTVAPWRLHFTQR